MTPKEISENLANIACCEDFEWKSLELVDAWKSAGVGLESIEPILDFIESHPSIEYGMPGHLVGFVEQFYLKGYEKLLIDSVNRKPTPQTLLMLNRLINGTKNAETRGRVIQLMDRSRFNSQADEKTIKEANEFLEQL